MPNNDYDALFDQWGKALNVNPQLAKTVFQMESSGKLNGNPMGIQPETANKVAADMGWDPKQVDVSDMRWAVPIGMRVLADGLNKTQRTDGAFGYYNNGQTDPSKWNQDYIDKATGIYPSMTVTPPKQPSGSDLVNTATTQLGQTGSTVSPFLQAHHQSLDPTKANWCAAFVNGVLDANGVQGTQGPGKNVATGFLKWGQPVDGDPQAGDVLVQPRGHPAGGIGGHVGIAVGPVAEGPSGTFYLMQSGNYNNSVSYSWEPAGSVVVRRAPELAQPPTSQPQPDQQQAAAAP